MSLLFAVKVIEPSKHMVGMFIVITIYKQDLQTTGTTEIER